MQRSKKKAHKQHTIGSLHELFRKGVETRHSEGEYQNSSLYEICQNESGMFTRLFQDMHQKEYAKTFKHFFAKYNDLFDKFFAKLDYDEKGQVEKNSLHNEQLLRDVLKKINADFILLLKKDDFWEKERAFWKEATPQRESELEEYLARAFIFKAASLYNVKQAEERSSYDEMASTLQPDNQKTIKLRKKSAVLLSQMNFLTANITRITRDQTITDRKDWIKKLEESNGESKAVIILMNFLGSTLPTIYRELMERERRQEFELIDLPESEKIISLHAAIKELRDNSLFTKEELDKIELFTAHFFKERKDDNKKVKNWIINLDHYISHLKEKGNHDNQVAAVLLTHVLAGMLTPQDLDKLQKKKTFNELLNPLSPLPQSELSLIMKDKKLRKALEHGSLGDIAKEAIDYLNSHRPPQKTQPKWQGSSSTIKSKLRPTKEERRQVADGKEESEDQPQYDTERVDNPASSVLFARARTTKETLNTSHPKPPLTIGTRNRGK